MVAADRSQGSSPLMSGPGGTVRSAWSLLVLALGGLGGLGGLGLAGVSGCGAMPTEASTATGEDSLIGGAASHACAWPSVGWLPGACTATLIHPRLIVYAAHCGTAFSSVVFDQPLPGRTVPLSGCVAHPDGAPGTGLDVAFCLLADEVRDIAIVPLLAGCEAELIDTGQLLTLVGFGATGEPSSIGTKREWTAPLKRLTRELIVGGGGQSICEGDSGAPAFVQLPPSSDGSLDGAWRLLGVASSTNSLACDGEREARVSPAPQLLAWIEEASGLDVTPCFDGAQQWRPTPGCGGFPLAPGAGETARGGCAVTAVGPPSSRCGRAFEPAFIDNAPPHIQIVRPASSVAVPASETVTLEVSVSADDGEGWGVQVVRLQLQDAGARRALLMEDETPPYTFTVRGVAAGAWRMRATAIDHAGLEASDTVALDLSPSRSASDAGGCAVGGIRAAPPSVAIMILTLALMVGASRWRPGAPRVVKAGAQL